MSYSDFIKFLFDLQDPNLVFLEDGISKIFTKDTYAKILQATLTKYSFACPHCNSFHTVKNAFKSSFIRFISFQEYPIQIALKKQRFLCRECQCSFLLESPIVKK